jgi:hypothetical protein
MGNLTCDISDLKGVLENYGGGISREVSKNPKLVQAMFEILRAAAEKKYAEVGVGFIGLTDAKMSKSGVSKVVKDSVASANLVGSIANLSVGLRVVGSLSTSRAMVVIGSTVVAKTGLALGLAGDDQERAKCTGAIMELAGNVAFTAATWETGAGAILGAFAIAASATNAYMECAAPGK